MMVTQVVKLIVPARPMKTSQECLGAGAPAAGERLAP